MDKPFAISLDVGSSRANPFPAVMGRVCYRPCETACNWAQLDSAVGRPLLGGAAWRPAHPQGRRARGGCTRAGS